MFVCLFVCLIVLFVNTKNERNEQNRPAYEFLDYLQCMSQKWKIL